ncbi:zinc finger transcription factor ace1 [Amniculicola lignicola CBS 123094]|uniref:Zinc finger transcription factor ace1 n=1 Tax=Amniculicola lignicola CBS 123094 TaxID=1392246 RepID=A0A6A5WEX2_9PLEO|nr:zinc finger transcription factor ace1 [Amniculicola lignicola CBS 123094]
MSAPQTHPRRRPLKATDPNQLMHRNTHGMQLRKSGTFSSPKCLSSEVLSLDNQQYMPRRSPTSVECLEELIQDASVHEHVTEFLKNFKALESRLADHKSANSKSSILTDQDVHPLPNFFVANASMTTTPMDIDPKPRTTPRSPHDHASDSGLGSSVSGSKYGKPGSLLLVLSTPPSNIHKDDAASLTRESISTSVSSTHAAITRSFSALGVSDDKHTLGDYACKQIHDHIIKPILAEESLKDFHPLINDVPRRIGEKNITNLRDLEKTLIFLAPEFSATPTSYLRFCERSIHLLHATVDSLSDQDQRLPTDRPYTNGYFLDLLEQIRRYAAIMAATRQKIAEGEDLDDMDYSPDEKITIRGGLSHDGKPAEFVREKDGKVIPLDDRRHSESSKRALSDDEDDEAIKRSMARRRKSDKPGDVMHTCRDCKKEFKRPCDLTKHEKTHSRPWKCSEEKCKYFDLGWPTEKERDRHVNDKHSAAPPQYKCHYPPCTYASKRESNCKQHMEKAHGWEYVRSKSNGRKRAPTTGSERTPPTPLTPYPGTPSSVLATTPMTPFLASPSIQMGDYEPHPYGFGTPAMSLADYHEDYRRCSASTFESSISTYSSDQSPVEANAFELAVTPEDTTINHNVDFTFGSNANFNNVYQQPTPAMSTGADFNSFDAFDFSRPLQVTIPPVTSGIPHLSPMAQPDVTLFSPQMQMDEGYGDYERPSGDFTLFDTTQGGNTGMNATAGFFPDLSQFGGQFDNGLYPETAVPNEFDELMASAFAHQH